MTTKSTYEIIVVTSFFAVVLFMILGSFVVSLKYIDLGYIIAFIIFGIKFFRME